MDTVKRMVAAAAHILKSRMFAVCVLAVVSTAAIVYVSFNVKAITVVDNDTRRIVLTLDDDPMRAVSSAGIKLEKGDEVLAFQEISVVEVNRAADVQVTADGITTIVRMANGSVADVLEKVGVSLNRDDKINVELSSEIHDGLDITVDRMNYQEYTVNETEKFTTITEYTNTLPPGRTYIKRAGVDGNKTITYRKTIKNGKVIKTEPIKEVVNRKMTPQIKLVGTALGTPISPAPFKIELDKKGQPVKYTAKYCGKATAYSSDRGYAGTRTASGRKAQVGVVAVDPRRIPYGTKLYIVSPDGSYVYGYAVAGDTGTALRDGRVLVDLFFDHYEECLKFGAKRLNVYVIG